MGRGRERGSREGMTAREIGTEREGKTGQREKRGQRDRDIDAPGAGRVFVPHRTCTKLHADFRAGLASIPVRRAPCRVRRFVRRLCQSRPRADSHSVPLRALHRIPRPDSRLAARFTRTRCCTTLHPRPLRSPDLPPAPPLIHGPAPFHCTSELSLENIMLELIEKVTTRRGAHLWLG